MDEHSIVAKEPVLDPDLMLTDIDENHDDKISSCRVHKKKDDGTFEYSCAVTVHGGDGTVDPELIRTAMDIVEKMSQERFFSDKPKGMLTDSDHS